jgi:muramidase (phage lysozyme)
LSVLSIARLSLLACLALFATGPKPADGQSAIPTQATPTHPSVAPAQLAAAQAGGPYALSPQRRALLDTIRYAEGTWKEGCQNGYRTLYGGGLFQGLARHPEITVRRRYTSAAAGAYQFLPGTWREVAGQLRLSSFEPHNQDQAALHLIRRRGGLELLDRQGISRELMARLAPEWASLPTLRGTSHYGQPVKSYRDLQLFYSEALLRHRPA